MNKCRDLAGLSLVAVTAVLGPSVKRGFSVSFEAGILDCSKAGKLSVSLFSSQITCKKIRHVVINVFTWRLIAVICLTV